MRMLATVIVTGLALAVAQESPPDGESKSADAAKSRMDYFTFTSKTLKQELEAGVYVPAGYDDARNADQRYPVVYFLHGLWLDAHNWERRGTATTLDQLIEKKEVAPMIVVCADGKKASMWVNAIDGSGDWADYVATELVATIDARYRTRADRSARALSGESMGGYGALNIAFKHPEIFASVSALSAAIYPVDPSQLPDRIKQWAQQWKPVYGWPIDVKHWEDWNPLELAASLPEDELKELAIYFDCGDADRYGFHKTNEQLHEALEKRGIPHQWTLRKGGHGHAYFEEYVGQSLIFHGNVFKTIR